MKFFLFNDPEWDYATYDFSDWDKDSELAGSVLSAVDPNLQPFASRGGKLILWHGWSDAALPAQATIDYYQQVLNMDPKAMDHTRLFMIPGVTTVEGVRAFRRSIGSLCWWTGSKEASARSYHSPKRCDSRVSRKNTTPFPLSRQGPICWGR